MIQLKSTNNINLFVCEEEFCQEESTRIWANSQTRIVDLCDYHYSKATE
jgi:hypothetical protein